MPVVYQSPVVITGPENLPKCVPFSIYCRECDCDSPETYTAAVLQGWTEIVYHPDWFMGANFLGDCPEHKYAD